jgi:S-DNA-T family DNA segregation ATPase FtsK/SpoIIIE
MYSKYDDILNMLSREGEKYGIYFILTLNTPNGLRFKLKQNFSLTYVLQQNNPDDYITILGNINKTYPAKIFGRGIIKIDAVYEFQTALVTEKDNITKYIKEKCDELSIKSTLKAKNVPVLPSIVTYQDIANEFGKSNEVIIGIDKDELEIVKFNFEKNYSSIITSIDIDSTINFINPLINQIIAINKSKLFVINAEEILIDQKYTKFYQYYENKFDEVFNQLLEYVNDKNKIYKESNCNKEIFKNEKPIECIIIGLDSFKNKLNDENKLKFEDIFNNAKDLGVINYILVDSINKIKKNELETWYKNSVNTSEGIWIGNGINDQFSIKLNQRIEAMKENVPNNFCFVIKKGKPIYVKYLEKLELNIKQ